MILLAINFDNLHQILRNLYMEMMPICGQMVGVAKAVAGLGALFYVAYRVWQALGRAEPLDVFPLLRPFAIGLCIMFFPTVVLGTINAVMSPVVTGTHAILESQITNVEALQAERNALEYAARVREGKEWLVDDNAYEEKLGKLGIRHVGKIVSMWWERAMYGIKMWFRELITDFFELLYHAAALTIDTLRTFFLIVLSILGPLSFALSIYDGFQSTLTNWISRYISIYLWLPVADLFSAVLSNIQALMLKADIALLKDPSYVPDGSNGMYIVFLIIGIIGYFSIPTVAGWIIQAGGGGSYGRNVNTVATKGSALAGGIAGSAAGNVAGRLVGK
jgi:conjugative transposon TraJ protein